MIRLFWGYTQKNNKSWKIYRKIQLKKSQSCEDENNSDNEDNNNSDVDNLEFSDDKSKDWMILQASTSKRIMETIFQLILNDITKVFLLLINTYTSIY